MIIYSLGAAKKPESSSSNEINKILETQWQHLEAQKREIVYFNSRGSVKDWMQMHR